MSASDNLSTQQFIDYHTVDAEDYDGSNHAVIATMYDPKTKDIKDVGSLNWDKEDGRIGMVHVEPEHRRKGIATAMYKEALSSGLTKPHHAERMTDDGLAWAKAQGDAPDSVERIQSRW